MSDTNYAPGVTGLELLGVAFIALKLCHVINWSWWLVTAPIWGGAVFALALVIVAIFVAVIVD